MITMKNAFILMTLMSTIQQKIKEDHMQLLNQQ